MVCVPSLSDLPPPNVTISFSGSSTAGQSYSLNCLATVVPDLVTEPHVQLVFPNSTIAEGSSSVEQSFSPLRTSDGGQYTCTATVNVPQAGIANLSNTIKETVNVQSELVCFTNCLTLSLSLSPQFPSPVCHSLVKWYLQWISLTPHSTLEQSSLSHV